MSLRPKSYQTKDMKEDHILDVAIVGGGVSGVYSAWRLLTAGGKKKVATVFEADEHRG